MSRGPSRVDWSDVAGPRGGESGGVFDPRVSDPTGLRREGLSDGADARGGHSEGAYPRGPRRWGRAEGAVPIGPFRGSRVKGGRVDGAFPRIPIRVCRSGVAGLTGLIRDGRGGGGRLEEGRSVGVSVGLYAGKNELSEVDRVEWASPGPENV